MYGPRIAALAVFLLLTPFPTHAQTPAPTASGKQKTEAAPAAIPAVVDFREEMRRFVQLVSTFARQHRPDFVVLPQNALELLNKVDPLDDTLKVPARTYMRSIDGVLQESLFYGKPEFGKPTPEKSQKRLIELADFAKSNGLKVLVVDYAKERKPVQDSLRRNAARGYVGFAAPGRDMALNRLPSYANWPRAENSLSILSLKNVKNFVAIRNSAPMGRQDEFAMKVHGTNFDMVIVDVFHGRVPLSKQAVETLKYKKLGARRLVLAYLNIGAAASYHYYWKPKWREGSPIWISAPFRNDPDKYYVEYWRPEWQKIITGDNKSYLFGIIDQGFDGVVLDGVETYRFFETGGELEQAGN